MFSRDMADQLKKSPEFIVQARKAFEDRYVFAANLWDEENQIYHPMYQSNWLVFLNGFAYGAQLRAVP